MQKRTARAEQFFEKNTFAQQSGFLLDCAPKRAPLFQKIFCNFRAVRRALMVFLWTLPCIVVQSVFLKLPGPLKIVLPLFYWKYVCKFLGVKIRVIGETPGCFSNQKRPLIYVSNHTSWLDVPVLGGILYAGFVAKEDVGTWPFIGLIAHLGRTIFVSRQRGSAGRERDNMRKRLSECENLILFPEGTSSDGSRVLPFLSAFFSIAAPVTSPKRKAEITPLLQPVSVVYDRLDHLPVGKSRRIVFAWYGDMNLAPHLWKLCQWRDMQVTVILHPLIDPNDHPSRKALAQEAWKAVDQGAASLRQMRFSPDTKTKKAKKA